MRGGFLWALRAEGLGKEEQGSEEEENWAV